MSGFMQVSVVVSFKSFIQKTHTAVVNVMQGSCVRISFLSINVDEAVSLKCVVIAVRIVIFGIITPELPLSINLAN